MFGAKFPSKENPRVTETAEAYGEASRAYDALLAREPGNPPSDGELKAALATRDAAERAWIDAYKRSLDNKFSTGI